jgi:hypothetical protein
MITKKQYIKLVVLMIGFSFLSHSASAQILELLFGSKKQEVKKDTVKPAPRPDIKSYESVINKSFVHYKGLFTVHKNRDTIYFEIPDSILHRDILMINRLAKASYGIGNYPGELMDQQTIQYELGPDSTLLVKYDLVVSEADVNSNIYKAVKNSQNNPIVYTFPIAAYNKKSKAYVINVTKLLKEPSFINNISKRVPAGKNTSSPKDFHIERIHTYPFNVEIAVSQNVTVTNEPQKIIGIPGTIETNTSFIILPEKPLMRRYKDDRVGYFADGVTIFSDDQQKVDQQQFITRWRLEPRNEDIEKWKRGELVEPQKPIVIYIDPATPKQWQPYLIMGINDWQKAFEQAGFKNAIMGKAWPENDTTMHMDDARYSFINYFPSETQNAYGPNVHDPRSGEIIQTHIGWYANVTSLLYNWYLVQAGAVDPKARKPKFDDELMGSLIRFVSSHEVGHTLGLTHNFGSSSQTPVDSLRNKHYLDAHGHTASIMDYARFNYVAQPEDHIPQSGLFPHIGEYDKWAIEWGYRASEATNADDDKKIVSKWIDERTTKNPRLWFGDGETPDLKFDPRSQTEDLGDDAVKASNYGIKNLQRILPNLSQWTYEPDNNNQNLADAYKEIQTQYFRFMGHVLRYVGGYYRNNKSEDQKGAIYVPEPLKLQQKALAFFDEQLFQTPYWLLNQQVLNKIVGRTDFVNDIQTRVLNSLFDIDRLDKIRANYERFGNKSISLEAYITTIHHNVWGSLKGTGSIKEDSYRRNLQKTYLGAALEVLSITDQSTENDAGSIIRADLSILQGEIRKAIARTSDPATLYHLKDIQLRIKNALNTKQA